MIVVVSIIDQPWQLPLPGVRTMWSVVVLAVFGTALAYIVFFKILVRAGPSNVMLVTLLIPVTAMLLGSLFLDEVIRLREVAGALIIAAGLLFIDGRVIKRITGRTV
jgi:drug/metabolite transporter (DMT)-like permease